MHQRERGGIEGFFELDMAVAMQLRRCPGRRLGGDVRQGAQEVFLHLGKADQRLLSGGAVDAVSGRAHDPLMELTVGVGQIPKFPQRLEALFDVLDAGLDHAFLLGIPWRAGGNEEGVAFGKLGIGPLGLRLVIAGADDGAFGVVDDHPEGRAAEVLESPAMTAQPGFHALVGDQFGVHVLAARERHDEEPCLHDLAGMDVGDDGACAKVDLGGLGWRMIKKDGGDRR